LLFINDIILCVPNSRIILYADDLKIFRTTQTVADCILLQNDLNSLFAWSVENRLPFNIGKCEKITCTRKKTKLTHICTINGEQLKEVEWVRDLGVIIDKRLDFGLHTSLLIKKSKQLVGFLIRNCGNLKYSNAEDAILRPSHI